MVIPLFGGEVVPEADQLGKVPVALHSHILQPGGSAVAAVRAPGPSFSAGTVPTAAAGPHPVPRGSLQSRRRPCGGCGAELRPDTGEAYGLTNASPVGEALGFCET